MSGTRRRLSSARRGIALTLVVMLVVPAVAVARRIATGNTKTAIVRVVPTALPIPQRCRVVAVREDLSLPCAVTAPPPQAGHFPVMGGNARGADPSPAPIAAYAPSRCYLSRVGPGAPGYGDAVNLQSIVHVRWSHWGTGTARGHGDIVSCGTGCTTVRATMTVDDLTTSQLVGGKAYTRLRVRFSASYPTKHTATVTYNVKPVQAHAF